MKKILFAVILVLSISVAFCAFASGVDDSQMWEYNLVEGGVELTAYYGDQTDVYVPNKITVANETLNVVKLGNNLFKGNTALNSATLGEGITEIGASAFEGATNLVCIVTPESLTTIGDNAFSGCTSFNSVILYDGVISIGDNAFFGCDKATVYCNEGKTAYNYVLANSIKYEILNPDADPEIYTVNGITYYIMNGEAVTVSFNGTTSNVTIPTTVKGYPVTELKKAFYGCTGLKSITIPDSVTSISSSAFENCTGLTSITIPDSVTTIGNKAFYNCTNLTNITIPDSVTIIGSSAFYNCTKLTSITIPDSVTVIGYRAFYGCSGFTSITIPDSVTTIGNEAFYNCTNLTNITIPDSVTTIGSSAFEDCYSLASITIPDSVTTIGYRAFHGCSGFTSITIPDSVTTIVDEAFQMCTRLTSITIPDSVTTIGSSAFSNCTSLTSITIPDSITTIGDSVFSRCSSLTSITIPNSVTTIGYCAFGGCSGFTSITIPDSVTTIGDIAFTQCTRLTSITIPDSVTTIGDGAFTQCTNLTSITIPDSVTTIGSSAFSDCTRLTSITIPGSVTTIGSSAFSNCASLTSITIPNSVTSIDGVFYQCTGLTSITIPDSVTTIGRGAFNKCTSLTSITIPDSVTTIGNWAFYECTNLTSITIPDSVTLIDERAFYGCTSLTSITIPNSVTTIGDEVFNKCTSLTKITIPDSVTTIGDSAFPSGIVLGVYENSYAHTYAINNNVNYHIVTDGETTKIVESGGITYFLANGKATVQAFDNSVSDVIIPRYVEGFPVTAIGSSAFYKCTKLTSITIPDSVTTIGSYAFSCCFSLTSITIPDSITTISDGVFYYCDSLTSITIPDSVTTIGNEAFWTCDSLTSITIPNSVTIIGDEAFYSCSGFTSITIPDSVTIIGRNAFSYCDNLTKITIPDSVTTIGSGAFEDCYSLASITIPDSVTTIGDYTFFNCYSLARITIPNLVTTIGNGAFGVCTKLTSITIPDSVTTIGDKAFYKCTKLTSITIPDSVTTIGDKAFYNCTRLASVIIGDSVISIGDEAFYECTSLTSITIPDSVTTIGFSAFSGCDSLANVIIGDSVTTIGNYAFSNCDSLANVIIGDSVTTMGGYTFYSCDSLASVIIGDSLTTIGNRAFSNCYSLASVIIGDSVTLIDECAFENCTSLISITIPDSVTKVRYRAFYGCTNLKSVVIPKNVIYIESNSFGNTTIWCVYKDSYAHTFAEQNNLLYFIIRETANPEIAYGSAISGTATYTNGTAANVDVDILYDDGTVKETVTTDSSGNYEITYAEVGRYTIRVTDNDGNTASEVVSVKRMNVFDVYIAGETDLVLKNGYTVSGTVIPETAKVTLSDTKGNVIKSVDVTDGVFSFTDISRGSYIVKAENETGSVNTEIYVSNSDITDVSLEIKPQSATISGDTKIETRDGMHIPRVWVTIDLVDEDGNVVARTTTDENGRYTFECVTLGTYGIVAVTHEMRPAHNGGFDKSHELKGYGYIDVTEFIEYNVDTIILREEKINLSKVEGKVKTKGVVHDCKVLLTDEDGNEIAVTYTNNNGTYSFKNIPDGIYCITAITKVDGMGFSVITVENGVVYGDTVIVVEKADKIEKREETLFKIPECNTKEDVLLYKEAVLSEKRFYDSLSEKEKKHLSKTWIDLLFKLIDMLSDTIFDVTEGVVVEDEESIISPEEIESDETVKFVLNVTETEEVEVGDDGITTAEEYETEKIKDKKGKNKNIAKYYDITFTKDGQNISNIKKQTETNGKLRITMEIPEEYRGHKHYSFIHMHKGETITLVDLDDNPNTITFEIDKFSTLALAYSDVELVGEVEEKVYPANITYNDETGKISVTTTEAGKLYVATYNGNELDKVDFYDISSGTTNDICNFTANQKAFIWNENMMPLCEKFNLN